MLKNAKGFIAKNADSLTIILLVVGFLLTVYLVFWRLHSSQRNFINAIAIIGTTASFFGLTIAFIQIIALKEISEVTKQTITETKSKLILGISISDVAESMSLTQEIENYINGEKYEIAKIRIKDLRNKLIIFKSNNEFQKIINIDTTEEIIEFLNSQIVNLNENINSEEEIKYDSNELNKQLQIIATKLTDFQTNIKYATV